MNTNTRKGVSVRIGDASRGQYMYSHIGQFNITLKEASKILWRLAEEDHAEAIESGSQEWLEGYDGHDGPSGDIGTAVCRRSDLSGDSMSYEAVLVGAIDDPDKYGFPIDSMVSYYSKGEGFHESSFDEIPTYRHGLDNLSSVDPRGKEIFDV